MQKNKNGFTLIELLAVVAILGVVIAIATTSVLSILRRARSDSAEEMQTFLQDAAITYSLENMRLEKCSESFSREVFERKDISHFSANTNCAKKVTVGTLIDKGFFEDGSGYCKRNEEVIVYRYTVGQNSEYKAYVSSNACRN